jgi:tetratricopeptide (TPR) repeat protein/transcriptional regulator with XRE-family HTH domain
MHNPPVSRLAGGTDVAEAPVTFSDLLRRLRTGAHLTQEELATAANLSRRAVSDLERGVATTPQRDTVRLLADALHLLGPERAQFEAVGRGRPLDSVSAATAAAAMRSLPRDVASFIGRRQELEQMAEAAAGAGGVVSIHVIGGMAGVGKTAFAVHAGHRLADAFPDGQIFVLLHGHTPGRRPTDPADALAGMMLTIGVPPGQIPAGLEARMALWRDRVAGRQLLLVLDDAASSQQVLPLLPGRGGSLVLVTSRRHLSALDDATAISLDIMLPAEAAALLVRLAGRAGLSPDDPAVAEITRLCGYLPLAIGMVARQLRHHQTWSAAGRAAELAAAVDRVDLMATENVSVAAAFDLSYANLTSDQQRLFRRLGLHPGADIDAYAAAALDGTDLATARRGLEALYDQYLLTEPAQGRYRQHDLIREHARALAARDDSAADRDLAVARLLDYYQYTAARADALIARSTRPASATADVAVPAEVPALADFEQALAWARAERGSLLACLDHAASTGQQSRIMSLTGGIAGLLRRDGPWDEAITRHTAAAEAGRHVGDGLGQANALTDLGEVRCMTGNYPAAAQALEQALGIFRDLGQRLGEANDLGCLGLARYMTGDYRAAARALEQALDLYRDLGDQRGEANVLHHLGIVRWLTGDYPAAALALEHALGLYRDLGDRPGQANTLLQLGGLKYTMDDYPAAAQALEQALGLYRDFNDRLGEANALTFLGQVLRMTGNVLAAIQALEQALDIDRELGSRLGQTNAIHELGILWRLTGDYEGALQAQEQALGVYRDLGVRAGEASAVHQLGIVWRMTGDYPAAARALEQALGIYRDLGERSGEAAALNDTGTLRRVTGELVQAEACHHEALSLARAIASSWNEAHATAGLGRCALAARRATQAKILLQEALEIFQRIGAADAADLQAELDALTGPPQAKQAGASRGLTTRSTHQ